MERISVRGLATAIRLIREPVVVTYSYPRSHPLYGAGEECGVFVPMALWTSPELHDLIEQLPISHVTPGANHPANETDEEFQG